MSMIKSQQEIESIRAAGQIVGSLLFDLQTMVQPGVTPQALNDRAVELIRARGGELAFLGFEGFPAAICISVNEEVVHGIPGDKPFVEGDIVGIDAGARVDGFYADAAVTVAVGVIDEKSSKLLKVTQQALMEGIARVHNGAYLGDVQAAIQRVIEAAGMGIIYDLTGHGIGKELHEEPEIANFGRAGTGPILRSGMTICLEPMVSLGKPDVYLAKDGWTIVTRDHSRAAQFEHTLLVGDTGAEILTPVRAWPMPNVLTDVEGHGTL